MPLNVLFHNIISNNHYDCGILGIRFNAGVKKRSSVANGKEDYMVNDTSYVFNPPDDQNDPVNGLIS